MGALRHPVRAALHRVPDAVGGNSGGHQCDHGLQSAWTHASDGRHLHGGALLPTRQANVSTLIKPVHTELCSLYIYNYVVLCRLYIYNYVA